MCLNTLFSTAEFLLLSLKQGHFFFLLKLGPKLSVLFLVMDDEDIGMNLMKASARRDGAGDDVSESRGKLFLILVKSYFLY